LDYGGGGDIGKPTAIDIKETKTTLPLNYALNKAEKKLRKHIIYLVKNKNEDTKSVQEVVNFVKESGGIEYATQRMHQYVDDAKAILSTFPQNEASAALEQLVDYTVNRKK
jgi:octaprenyl-diphosphate synthase